MFLGKKKISLSNIKLLNNFLIFFDPSNLAMINPSIKEVVLTDSLIDNNFIEFSAVLNIHLVGFYYPLNIKIASERDLTNNLIKTTMNPLGLIKIELIYHFVQKKEDYRLEMEVNFDGPWILNQAAMFMYKGTMEEMREKVKEIFSKWREDNLSFKSMRSWGQFFNRTKFSFPKIMDIPNRVKTNVTYFQVNYLVVFIIILLYAILSNPWFLFAIAIIGAMWGYVFQWREQPIMIASHEVSYKEKVIALSVVTVISFYFASVSNTIFWLIGATLTVVSIHALFYSPIEEELDFMTTFGEQKV